MTKRKHPYGTKAMTLNVPIELHENFSKICIDFRVTRTEAILRYMEYLKKTHRQDRRLLDENSDENSFRLEY